MEAGDIEETGSDSEDSVSKKLIDLFNKWLFPYSTMSS